MPSGPVKSFSLLDFSGGEVSRLANEVMRDNELILGENMSLEYPGLIAQRDPIITYSANTNSEDITAQLRWYKSDATTRRHFWMSSTKTGYIDDTTKAITAISTGLTANAFCNIVSAQDLAIFLNGKDSPRKASDTITTDTVLGGTPPVGNVGLYHLGKLYIGGDPLAPSRWYASAAGNVESWAASDFLNVDANDGSIIVGGISTGDRQGIFKESSIHTLDGDSAANWRLRPAVRGIGLWAPKTLVQGNGIAYFLGRQGSRIDQYGFLSGVPQRISQNITDRFKTNIDLTNNYKYSAFMNFPWLYLFYKDGSSAAKILQYDIGLNAFVTWSDSNFISSIASWPNGLDGGRIFVAQSLGIKEISTTASNSTAVKVQTKYLNFGSLNEKWLQNLWIHPQDIINRGDFTITYDIDFAGTYTDTLTFDERGRASAPDNHLWRYISFQIQFSASGRLFHGLFGTYGTLPLETAR